MKLFDVYPLIDITPVKAYEETIIDKKGDDYLDLYGGHAVISIGHSHPEYIKKISDQLKNISFYSNSVQIPLQEDLAKLLGEISGYDEYQLFLVNSGAEAIENALKLASFKTGKSKIIAFKNAFHGRTSGAVSITDNPNIISPFNDNHKVIFVDYDINIIEKELQKNDIAAVIIEPIQGVGGVIMPSDDFLKKLSELTTSYNTCLIADEIQCGYGRSGKFFAHQWAGIKPDLITIAKGMGNGFPIGGVLISPDFIPKHGLLGTTFGGNHLACAAAISVLEVIENENLIENSNILGNWFINQLKEIDGINEVRGRGLMIGIEFKEPINFIKNELFSKYKILVGASGSNVIRILPPLNVKKEKLEYFIKSLKNILENNKV